MKSRTDVAVQYLRVGDYSKALSIFSTFRMGFTKEQIRTMEIASDTVKGNGRIYKQLGINVNDVVDKAIKLLKEKYRV